MEEVFGRRAYRQGSLQEIAAAVGISVQGFLRRFGTNEGLLMALLGERNTSRAQTLRRIRFEGGAVALLRYLLVKDRTQSRADVPRFRLPLRVHRCDHRHGRPRHDDGAHRVHRGCQRRRRMGLGQDPSTQDLRSDLRPDRRPRPHRRGDLAELLRVARGHRAGGTRQRGVPGSGPGADRRSPPVPQGRREGHGRPAPGQRAAADPRSGDRVTLPDDRRGRGELPRALHRWEIIGSLGAIINQFIRSVR
ncbi:helix-turn-helix transcriptional regulator [Brachybacterium sp. MASK1Z-5]|uniref:Helix-turn-helix transcriptional regulator n=1 Tax=Brachybacterium halotolerans TaxID=2795215 RepID=A0ABS1B8D6_9MICO|nr:helix-turn-helix transcriptional regulator [Brachybacterium halotolerans]